MCKVGITGRYLLSGCTSPCFSRNTALGGKVIFLDYRKNFFSRKIKATTHPIHIIPSVAFLFIFNYKESNDISPFA